MGPSKPDPLSFDPRANREWTRRLGLRLAIALSCVLGLALAPPPAHAWRANTPGQELEQLIRVPCARRGDCLKAVAVLMTGNRGPTNMRQVIDLLGYCDVVRPCDLTDLDAPASRGYAAVLFTRALCERKSLLSRLFPGSERYAYKHMKFLRTLPGGGEQITISGPELLSLLALSQDYWDNPHRWWRRL